MPSWNPKYVDSRAALVNLRASAAHGGCCALIVVLLSGNVFGQIPHLRPKFEVASIRPLSLNDGQRFPTGAIREDLMESVRPVGIIPRNGDLVRMQDQSLLNLIATAYRVRMGQVSGPAWMSEQRFEVNAKIPHGAPSSQINEMLQVLLEERFRLEVHRESRNQKGYDLVVGAKGAKLKIAASDGKATTAEEAREKAASLAQELSSKKAPTVGTMRSEFTNITAQRFADVLTGLVGSPVVDMTALHGKYDVVLEFSPDVPGQEFRGVSIFEAVGKLGLGLKARKVAVECVVVDRVEKSPTPN